MTMFEKCSDCVIPKGGLQCTECIKSMKESASAILDRNVVQRRLTCKHTMVAFTNDYSHMWCSLCLLVMRGHIKCIIDYHCRDDVDDSACDDDVSDEETVKQ